MRRWQTLTALGAVILASLAALPFRGRVLCATAAIVLIAVVGLSMLRAALMTRKKSPTRDAAAQAARIREARNGRFGRR